MKQDVIIITGATASGKSAIAVHYAKQCNGVVINADSMQLYREAPILTAQPTHEERENIPHHLYSVLPADNPCSAAHWVVMVCETIRIAWKDGVTPVLAGGTGMYIRALMQGLSAIPDIDPTLRAVIRGLPTDELHEALCKEDPLMAARLNAGDSQRMARALEVIRATGQSLSLWQKQAALMPLPEAQFKLHITTLDRPILYNRINTRVDAMMDRGALAEARTLHALNLPRSLPLLRAVGVVELLHHLDGNLTYDEAITTIKTHSRRYAKRQMTWMRQQFLGDTVNIVL